MNYFEDLTKVFTGPLYDFGQSESIPIALENIDMPTSVGTPYLAGFMLNAPVTQADLSVNEFRTGIYQIDINYAAVTGSADINRMADKLNLVFKAGEYLTYNDICVGIESVSLERLIVGGGWATRSMSIVWNSYTPRL